LPAPGIVGSEAVTRLLVSTCESLAARLVLLAIARAACDPADATAGHRSATTVATDHRDVDRRRHREADATRRMALARWSAWSRRGRWAVSRPSATGRTSA